MGMPHSMHLHLASFLALCQACTAGGPAPCPQRSALHASAMDLSPSELLVLAGRAFQQAAQARLGEQGDSSAGQPRPALALAAGLPQLLDATSPPGARPLSFSPRLLRRHLLAVMSLAAPHASCCTRHVASLYSCVQPQMRHLLAASGWWHPGWLRLQPPGVLPPAPPPPHAAPPAGPSTSLHLAPS